ncbi:DUF924 family protein [Kaistia nematophila]|uniref:DUF924 domain-containing protein n=1 Tax=Kaistia nematophila TaxID=2994654 RepID=A0A9X3E1F7_9HYPH|nr:DUF924 family protein [Kaistia nematophila]MCX5567958.1 DUF924 domain-containing protein [Kaistia nematophila]
MTTDTLDPAILLDAHCFWFEELVAGIDVPAERVKVWFSRHDATDDACRVRFGAHLDAVADTDWSFETLPPAAGIGFVLFLDQFPRNLFRDDGRAFAYDARARAAVRRLIAGGVERFAPIERVFLYLPFEHSEELADQDLSVSLYEALLAEVPEADKEDYQSFVGYAEKHRDLIRRFGRFPHRNADLGRASTPEEIEFLKDGRGY